MLECSEELQVISVVVFSACNVYSVSYTLFRNVYSKSVKHLFASFVSFVWLVSVIALQIDSDCPMFYVSWGAASLATVFFILIKEACTCCTASRTAEHGVDSVSEPLEV